MRGVPNLGRIFGVSIRLHYTWVLVLALIIAIMVTQFPEAYPLWHRISFGVATSFLFFISVSIREFLYLPSVEYIIQVKKPLSLPLSC
jgi:Zn-dependent protease